MSASSYLQRKPLPEARALLLAGVRPVEDEEIAVDDAAGRIAAETLTARHPSPHYRASAMDGIAVRAADTWAAADAPVLLATLATGSAAAAERCCAPVDTGSLLPEWADAVVRIENTTPAEGGYRIRAVVPPGTDVRREGEDIEAGAALVRSGTRLSPWDLGALLATGTTRLRVRRRPRIGILATGGEVVDPVALVESGRSAGAGQVIEYNTRMIAALVSEWGATPHRLGIVADDEQSLAAAVADAASRFDVACVIAGSSAGRKDFTIAVLSSLGEVFVHGVDMAPGRPVALARVPRGPSATAVLAIPGYPVSAIVVCERLLRPLVAALLGTTEPPVATMRARLARKIPSRLGMEEFRRVCLVRQADGSHVVAPLPAGAGSISSVAGAHAWLRIPSTAEGIDAGAVVEVELMVVREDVDSALVLAGSPCAASAALEEERRRHDPRARCCHLRLAAGDAVAALRRGEAHAAIVSAEEAAAHADGLDQRTLPDGAVLLAVDHLHRGSL
ncbi:MAG: molybdopterin-binding protein [Candidatus Binatia bacterium]